MNPRALLAITAGALLALGSLATYLASTGDVQSPLVSLLLLPVLLGALLFGFAGSLLAGTLMGVIFLLMGLPGHNAPGLNSRETLFWAAVLLLAAVTVGSFAEEMRRRISEAAARAQAAHERAVEQEARATEQEARATEQEARAAEQEARAAEKEYFLDTSVMMESMYDLEATLSVALIRLWGLVPCTTSAVFLREPDAQYLSLAQGAGLPSEGVAVENLPLGESEGRWRVGDVGVRLWADIRSESASELGALAHLDPSARSVIVAPLGTLEEFLGLIFVGVSTPGALTERHRELVERFAQYVVFPIHRMRLRAQATTDEMTRLENYRAFRLRLADETRRASRYGHPLSLILLDVDHFKRINDAYLHVAGDAVLRQMAGVLRGTLRGSDVAARYGGEEMAILCPETGASDARILAERIRATVERHRFTLPEVSDAGEIGITVSLGVAALPTHASGDTGLVEQADRALYTAKEAGRNRVCVAEENPGEGTSKGKSSLSAPLRS